MASISNDPNNRRGGNSRKRILFMAPDGKRKCIRLGPVTRAAAEQFKSRLDTLLAELQTGIGPDTAKWLAELPDELHSRLAAVGLVKSRSRQAMTLDAFLAEYFKAITVKPGTEAAYDHTRRCLVQFFGAGCNLRTIGPEEADKWRQAIKAGITTTIDGKLADDPTRPLADATVGRRVGVARQMFKLAVKWKLISENPFADVPGGSQTNKSRMFFIARDVADKVIDACPDAQWKLLFALSRYGGLRCPSEHLALKWGDITWNTVDETGKPRGDGRIRVPSCKTEHHAGGDHRFIPLFPELEPYLQAVFDEAEIGAEYVITRWRGTNSNLRTELLRIMARAGVKPWPKLFHNLRATRQTELVETYPLHVVCAWIGNSQDVAKDHYLQVTDAHFATAATMPTPAVNPPRTITATTSAGAVAIAAQNAAHLAAQTPLDGFGHGLPDNPENITKGREICENPENTELAGASYRAQ